MVGARADTGTLGATAGEAAAPKCPHARTPPGCARIRGYGGGEMINRPCSRVACAHYATTTLTYVYADSMAVLGPLSTKAEPHSYDLCDKHAERLSAPQGWQIVRHVVMGDVGFGA
jgi:hypothetical protein